MSILHRNVVKWFATQVVKSPLAFNLKVSTYLASTAKVRSQFVFKTGDSYQLQRSELVCAWLQWFINANQVDLMFQWILSRYHERIFSVNNLWHSIYLALFLPFSSSFFACAWNFSHIFLSDKYRLFVIKHSIQWLQRHLFSLFSWYHTFSISDGLPLSYGKSSKTKSKRGRKNNWKWVEYIFSIE